MAERRSKMVAIRLSPTEYEMFAAVADEAGLTLSDWLRQSFRKAHKRLLLERAALNNS